MATVTQKIFTCDMCGNENDVQTRAFGFDGKRYEIDLCPKDSDDLNKVVAGYSSKARKVTAGRGQRRNGHRPNPARPAQQAAKASGARAKSAGSKETRTSRSPQQEVMAAKETAATSRSESQDVMAAPKQAAKASRAQAQKAKTAPTQAARAGRSRQQEVMAAPKQAARASRAPQRAKTAAKQAAGASRAQGQNAKAAPKPASRAQPQKAKAAPKQGAGAGRTLQKAKAAPEQPAKASRAQPQKAKAAPKRASKADSMQQEKGVYVYGILPADIEVGAETRGVGERPAPLGIVYSDGLAALISEVGLPARLGSAEDLRTYREILDSTAIEVPVVPLRFGTVFTGEGSVADELLAPRHDEFATALQQLEGRAQFLVKGRYVEEADTAGREEDTRALRQAMEGISADSVVRKPAHEREAFHVAFLVDVDKEREVERVIEDLGRGWEGQIEVRLLGPMAAYDFVMTDGD